MRKGAVEPGRLYQSPLRKVNTRGSRSITGYVCSRKVPGRTIPHESQNELKFIQRAEIDPRVTSILAQPILVEFIDADGSRARAYPDFAIEIDGRTEIHEVKPDAEYARPANRDRLRRIADACERHGHSYSVALASELHRRRDQAALAEAWRRHRRDEHLTPPQIEALALAENRIGDESSFSTETVSLIVQDLAAVGDFDLSTTGFDTGEIDFMLVEPDVEPQMAEVVEPLREEPAISRIGDRFTIGNHVIICGNALEEPVYRLLLGDERPRASINDLPYNVKINGNVSGSGRHAEFPMASGEMSPEAFTAFINGVSKLLATYGVDGSLHYLFMDFRHMRELLDGASPAFTQLMNLCVWVKDNAGMGSLYRSQHELVFVFKSGSAAHINNVELGKHGRNRSNVWKYAGANSFGKGRDRMLAQHPTSKNVGMIADAVLDCTDRGDIVLDAFLGSGTTLIACERTGRRCRGIELDPYYVDLAVLRAERLIGQAAVHTGSGQSFAELTHARRNPGWSVAA